MFAFVCSSCWRKQEYLGETYKRKEQLFDYMTVSIAKAGIEPQVTAVRRERVTNDIKINSSVLP